MGRRLNLGTDRTGRFPKPGSSRPSWPHRVAPRGGPHDRPNSGLGELSTFTHLGDAPRESQSYGRPNNKLRPDLSLRGSGKCFDFAGWAALRSILGGQRMNTRNKLLVVGFLLAAALIPGDGLAYSYRPAVIYR